MKIAYCTIASANYLSRVRVLEDSLLSHNPNASFHILLCERPEVCRSLSADLERPLISPDEVCADWLQMAFCYDIVEYNTALKPYLLEHLLNNGYEAVFYFDPDIEIFGSLAKMESLAATYDLILTPHVCEPMPMDGLRSGIDDIIRAGQFNLGFIGIAKSAETLKSLNWWQGVCREYCIFDAQHRFFVDQFWAAILPSFIQKFHCLRDPAYNMAYWNVFQRKLSQQDNRWLTDSGELKFFHFSGLAHDLTQVSRHQNRIKAPLGSPLHNLLAAYCAKIESNAWSTYADHPYSFSTYTNGKAVQHAKRRQFLMLPSTERDDLGDPFAHPNACFGTACPPSLRRTLFQKYLFALQNHGLIATHLAVLHFLRGLIRRPRFTRRGKL